MNLSLFLKGLGLMINTLIGHHFATHNLSPKMMAKW